MRNTMGIALIVAVKYRKIAIIAILERCARNAITSMMQNTGQRRGER